MGSGALTASGSARQDVRPRAPLRGPPTWNPGRALLLAPLLVGPILIGGGCTGQAGDTPGPADQPVGPTRPTAPSAAPLEPGDIFPALEAAGWLNGPPPLPPAGEVRLVVVDLWADWCPVCRQAAPDLLRLYDKHKGRGVAFVSLTNMPRQSAEAFVRELSIPWPNGYSVSPETLTALGVGSGMAMPAYAVAPTAYVVGADGRVRWSDRRARYRHTEPKEWARQLDDAIEAALASPPPAKP